MKWIWVGFVALALGILAYLLKRGSATGQNLIPAVSTKILPTGYTQVPVKTLPGTISQTPAAVVLGVPSDVYGRVSPGLLIEKVQYFVDPQTGNLIENDSSLRGLPIVELTDYAQANEFVAANPEFYKWMTTAGNLFTL